MGQAGDGLIMAGLAHSAALAAIHGASFPAIEAWSVADFSQILVLPGSFCWVSPRGGLILVRQVVDEAEILALAVMPERRRHGLGKALLRAAMSEAVERGAETIFLEVGQSNAPARTLYQAAGFGEVGRRRGYYAQTDGASNGNALVLRKDLLVRDWVC